MSITNYRLNQVLPPISSLVAALGVGGGVYGLIDPQAFSGSLGIPVTSSVSPAIPFVSFIAARNLGTGIGTLALLYNGQRKVVGMLFMCGTVVAFADAWICAKYGATEGKALAHGIMGTVIALLGAGMYWA